MIHRLLLPALIPSWRFFDTIAPSPRIEFALLHSPVEPMAVWQEFRPRPPRLSLPQMALRLVWNPQWNENLFLTSCMEKLIDDPSAPVIDELLSRIARSLDPDGVRAGEIPRVFLKIRALVVKRVDSAITQEIVFISKAYRLARLKEGRKR